MDPPELASEPPRSRIELRAAFKSIGWGNVRGVIVVGPNLKRQVSGKGKANINMVEVEGKATHLASASASALLHPRCRCGCRNDA
jgi:hypothetical protein